MNPSLNNFLIEKKLLLNAIRKITDTLQEPRFWDTDTYQHIPLRLCRKVDAKIQEAIEAVKQCDELHQPFDVSAGQLYNTRKEIEVLNFLITDDCLTVHDH